MIKNILRLTALTLSLFLLSSCASENFKDLSVFIRHFDYRVLSVEDFYYEKDNDKNIFFTLIREDKSTVLLKLLCNRENKIEQVRIFLSELDENAKEKEITTEDIALFTKVVSSSVSAFTYMNKEDSEEILKEMRLYEKSSYKNEGELTKQKDNFYYVYLSSYPGFEFMITDTFLKKIEETKKPESRPAFGDTTNIRTETVPLK